MNKQQIVEILEKHSNPDYELKGGVIIKETQEKIADEIMALDKEEWCPCGMPVSICGGPDDTYDKLSELDSEKFPVRVEERPGGKTIYPVDIADATWPTTDPFKITIISPEVFAGKKLSEILVHEDDCECRQCRPDLWFQQDDVWTKKI